MRGNLGPVLIGYVLGSLFSMFQLWTWLRQLFGGPKLRAVA